MPEEKPVLTPHRLFQDGEVVQRLVGDFYRRLGESSDGQTIFTDDEDYVAKGFMNLAWDLTTGTPDRRGYLGEQAMQMAAVSAAGFYRDHERSLGSTLVARYGVDKVAQAASGALHDAGVGQVITPTK